MESILFSGLIWFIDSWEDETVDINMYLEDDVLASVSLTSDVADHTFFCAVSGNSKDSF